MCMFFFFLLTLFGHKFGASEKGRRMASYLRVADFYERFKLKAREIGPFCASFGGSEAAAAALFSAIDER